MIEYIYNFFASIFENNVVLATILISMIPIIEIKGSIPFATNEIIWKDLAITNWQALGWAILGSSIVVLILALIFKPIIVWIKKIKGVNRFGCAIENFVLSKSKRINESASAGKFYHLKKLLFILIFVSIPLPLTGVWTGTCIAVCLNIDYWQSCLVVILGNIIAGLIVTLILEFVPWLNNWLFFIFLGLILIFITIKTIIYLVANRNSNSKCNT